MISSIFLHILTPATAPVHYEPFVSRVFFFHVGLKFVCLHSFVCGVFKTKPNIEQL